MTQPLTYRVSATAHIDATPQRVYDIIADYRHGHPSILPDQFRNLTVEQGGVGDGTVIRFDVHVFGRTPHFRAIVTEPQPGRALVERNVEPAPSTTTFTVVPDGTAGDTRVTITTELSTEHTGILGVIERFWPLA
jgi:Polyketide cyclase / dehydrase and lipid transport